MNYQVAKSVRFTRKGLIAPKEILQSQSREQTIFDQWFWEWPSALSQKDLVEQRKYNTWPVIRKLELNQDTLSWEITGDEFFSLFTYIFYQISFVFFGVVILFQPLKKFKKQFFCAERERKTVCLFFLKVLSVRPWLRLLPEHKIEDRKLKGLTLGSQGDHQGRLLAGKIPQSCIVPINNDKKKYTHVSTKY